MQTQKTYAPFSCNYTPQLPELLLGLNCSIAVSTYQAGKLLFISPNENKENLHLLPRTFNKPMGFNVEDNKLVLATKNEVLVFQNSEELARYYPNKPNFYDSLWLPRITYYTGQVDIHDIGFGGDKIYAVNTSFSAICQIDGTYNFVPVWKPNFISDYVSEDRCHLNGMILENGAPKFVTALGKEDTAQSWRGTIEGGGVFMDVESNEIILDNLPMPHSPMLHQGKVYALLSASGEFINIDPKTKTINVIKKFDGFCRGLDIIGDYAFIGFSKLRKNSSTFAKLRFSDKAQAAGIVVLHIPSAAEVGRITFMASVDEIYEVKIMKGTIRPNILNTTSELHNLSLSIPNKTFWAGRNSTSE